MSVEDRAKSTGFSCLLLDTRNGCFSTKFSLRSNCSPNPAIKLVESNCVNMQSYFPSILSGSQGSSRQNQSVYSPCLWWGLSCKVLTVPNRTWLVKVLGRNVAENCPERVGGQLWKEKWNYYFHIGEIENLDGLSKKLIMIV